MMQVRKRPPKQHCPVCDTDISVPGDIRSLPQLKRYHALVRAVYEHWPERHERQFSSQEECRAWLQCKAGHHTQIATLQISGLNPTRAVMLVEAAIRAAGSYAFSVQDGSLLLIYRPKSISFAKLDHIKACQLFDEVAAVVLAEAGLQAEQLLAEVGGP